MEIEEKVKLDDKLIISQIKQCELEIQGKLKRKKEEASSLIVEEYFLINKSWIKKYISLNQKDDLFKDLIFFILKKISFNPRKSIYQNNLKKYEYYNNIKLISKEILPNLISIINNENNNILIKVLFVESKIILIMQNENSLEILNENYIPEYLLYFGQNKNISSDQMINIFIQEMKLKIPECNNENNLIYDYVTNNKFIITIINLKIIMDKEKNNSNKILEDNNNIINKLWEDKYKLKLEKNFDDIDKKINENYQKQINLNNENYNHILKNQIQEQNKIFSENYSKSVIKLNNLKEEEDEEKEKEENKEKIKINKEKENIENNIYEDYIVLEPNKKFDVMKLEDKDKINSFFSPVLFFLSQITSLTQYFKENEELIGLYNSIEDTLTEILFNFFQRLIDLDDDKVNMPLKGLFKENSNLVFDFLLSKMDKNSKIISSPGDILSFILENLQIEQDKYFQYLSEEESIIELNKDKKYDIYNEDEMLQKFVDLHTNDNNNLIYKKFHNIIKSSKKCKGCNKCSYDYNSFPTLKISLIRSNTLIGPIHPDYEIYNALINRVCFPENLSQLLSPSYSSIKKEFCKNCNNLNEMIYSNNIFTIKEYFIINIDRENDPKNEMMFIFPEILDLRKQSKCIINLYQLAGVICKKIKENNANINEQINENSKYICYFKIEKSNKWIVFDENNKLSELQKNENVFDFKGVCVLIYSKINED